MSKLQTLSQCVLCNCALINCSTRPLSWKASALLLPARRAWLFWKHATSQATVYFMELVRKPDQNSLPRPGPLLRIPKDIFCRPWIFGGRYLRVELTYQDLKAFLCTLSRDWAIPNDFHKEMEITRTINQYHGNILVKIISLSFSSTLSGSYNSVVILLVDVINFNEIFWKCPYYSVTQGHRVHSSLCTGL
jgi:hypothetical protein